MKPPIFVLGCHRSGTSVLRRILDTHPSIACPPESAFLVQLARVYEIKRALQGLLDMGFTEEDVLEQMRVFVASFFERYAAAKGKPRWADKTAPYVDHLDTIERMFRGNVVYVGIIRDGMDVAYSLSGFDWGVLKPYLDEGIEKPIAAIRFWKDRNEQLLAFRDKVGGRFHLTRYDEMTTQPEPQLRRLFDFLGESWDPAVLAFNAVPHDAGYEDPKVGQYSALQPNAGRHREWPSELQSRVRAEAADMLSTLGYQ